MNETIALHVASPRKFEELSVELFRSFKRLMCAAGSRGADLAERTWDELSRERAGSHTRRPGVAILQDWPVEGPPACGNQRMGPQAGQGRGWGLARRLDPSSINRQVAHRRRLGKIAY
jgi:hypothetical protein